MPHEGYENTPCRTSPRGYDHGVSDLSRDLPLFGRPPVDESSVSSNWQNALADVVDQAAAIIARGDISPAAAQAFLRDAALEKRASAPDLTAIAAAIRAGKPRRVRALSRGVTALLRLARESGDDVTIPPRIAGAVCLHRTGAAPLAIRAVIAGHTLRATDADWSFGRGPVLQDTSLRLLAFLCGVADEAPSRVTGPPSAAPATLDE